MPIPEIPAGAMEEAERVCELILHTNHKMFSLGLGGDHQLVIIAVRKNPEGEEEFCVISDFDAKTEMTRIMRDALRRSTDGSMVNTRDHNEPKH